MATSVLDIAVAVPGLNDDERRRCVARVAGIRGRALRRRGVRRDKDDGVVALDVEALEADVIDAGCGGVGHSRGPAEGVEPRRDTAGRGDQGAGERAAL